MPNKKITELTELTTPAYEDLLAIVDDPSGAPVTMKVTALNLLSAPRPTSPSAYDDEFSSGTLAAKWTAINCASGTVDLLNVAADKDCYDAITYPGRMALQPGRDTAAAGLEAEAAILRQTVTLATNCKIVARVHFNSTPDGSLSPSYPVIQLALSDADGFAGDNYFATGIVSLAGTTLGLGSSVIGGGAATPLTAWGTGMPLYIMITKTGNDFSGFVGDGYSWSALTNDATPEETVFTYGAGVMTRLTISVYFPVSAGAVNLFNPIGCFDFVRYFENNTPLVYE